VTGSLPEGLAAHLRLVQETVSRARAELDRMDRPDPRDAEATARREEAARRGDLGPEWQRVQRRIDAGRTTLADVFTGQDTSPEARRIAEQSRGTLRGARKAAEDDPQGQSADLLRDLDAVRARLRQAQEDLA
jgi:hypothetical protein